MSHRQLILLAAAGLVAVAAAGLIVVVLLPSADVVTPGAVPPAAAASDPATALSLARRVDLPLLATADRVVLDEYMPEGESGVRVTLDRPEEVAELRQVLRPREVPPGGGPVAATLTFYRGGQPLRTVWVIEGGEWGFERPGTSHATGADPDLWRLVRWHLRG
ncbi:MAG TPA: hypothetical protein VM533_17045 [Fimbriiglobus sp.]|jgi:hypothetical protein|nr:hypothetical protein [Fimbriiglobus sp.]